MKTVGAILLGFVLLDVCFSQTCPPCPATNDCDNTINVRSSNNKKCVCSICIKYCWDRSPRCVAGEVCVLEPVVCPPGYNCGSNPILSAVCKSPFTGCNPPPPECSCPVSGFLKDQNNCDSCLCNDPCAELQCSAGTSCVSWTVTPGTEFNYECQ